MFYRGRILAFGAIITLASGVALVSSVEHQLSGVATTATLLERTSECHIEFQLIGSNQRTQKPMECGAALAFQQRVGGDRIKFFRNDFARLRFLEPSGAPREARVDAGKVPASAKTGEAFAVVYDPSHPNDVRPPFSLQAMEGLSGLLIFGLALLSFGLGVNPLTIFGVFSAGRRRARAVAEPDAIRASRENAKSDPAPVIPAINPVMARPEPAIAPHSTATFGKRNAVRLNR